MRTREVVRLHAANPMQTLGWPLVWLLASLVIVLLVGVVVRQAGGESAIYGMSQGMYYNGAIFALIGPLIGFGFTAMGQHFALALGLGLTRREFALGTLVVFVATAVGVAAIVTIGKVIEGATNGYGLQVRFFDVVYTGLGDWWQTFVWTALVLFAVMLIGAAIVTAHLRWGQAFLWTFILVQAFVIFGLIASAMLSEAVRDTITGYFAMGWGAWMLLFAAFALVGGAAWLTLVRRAQAR